MTHPHADHLEGLIEVISRFEVENVLISGVNYDNPGYTELLSSLSDNSVNVFIAESRVDFKFGSVFLDVLYPFNSISGEKFENINNSSIVIKLNYAANKVLFTGDLEEEFERELVLSGIDLSTNILKAGHHGSRTASSPSFLNASKPEIVVIQVGEGNSYEHPHSETLRNYFRAGIEKVYRTDLDGRVDFYF
jgi:competence protein ComEC